MPFASATEPASPILLWLTSIYISDEVSRLENSEAKAWLVSLRDEQLGGETSDDDASTQAAAAPVLTK